VKGRVTPEERERIRALLKSAKPGDGVFAGTLVARLLDDVEHYEARAEQAEKHILKKP